METPDDYWVEVDGKHTFRYIGGPIENYATHQELFATIGRVVAAWGRMEQHIDALLIQINKQDHSSKALDLYDEHHPRQFVDKIRMLDEFFTKHPALAPYKATVHDFTTGLRKLAIERNELMHGIVEEYDPAARRVYCNGVRYRKSTNDFLNRRQSYFLARLEALFVMTNKAHYGLCAVSKELFTEEGAAKLRATR